MSKIFEALQRAQQAGNTPAEQPEKPAVAAPEAPATVKTAQAAVLTEPAPETSPLWDTAPPAAPTHSPLFEETPGPAEDLLFGNLAPSGFPRMPEVVPPAPRFVPPGEVVG